MPSGEQLNGSITFLPAEGQSGPSATTKLEAGKYQFDRTNGPTAGPHTVMIRRVVSRSDTLKAIAAKQPSQESSRPRKAAVPGKQPSQESSRPRKAATPGKQPPQENGAEWTLSADVADKGQYLQDLTLDK